MIDETIKPIDTAESLLNGYISRSGVKYDAVTGSNKAFYNPASDRVTMPVIGQFGTPDWNNRRPLKTA